MPEISTIKVDNIVYDIKAKYDAVGNNIKETYATKSDLPVMVSLTRDAYNALPDSKLTDGKYYFII